MNMSLGVLIWPAVLLGLGQVFVAPATVLQRTRDTFLPLDQLLNPLTVDEKLGSVEVETEPEARIVKSAPAPVTPLDSIIDFVLNGPIPEIISHGKSALPVPDFSFKLDTKLGNIFKVSGSVSCSGGTLQDVKSLHRQGPTVLTRQPNGVLLLQAAAGLGVLRLSYSKYNASVEGVNFSGQMQAEVSPAVMSAQIQLSPPCSVQLKALSVSQLGNLQVKITGLPKIYSGIPAIVEGLFDHPESKKEITSIIVSHVSEMIAQKLKKLSCK